MTTAADTAELDALPSPPTLTLRYAWPCHVDLPDVTMTWEGIIPEVDVQARLLSALASLPLAVLGRRSPWPLPAPESHQKS